MADPRSQCANAVWKELISSVNFYSARAVPIAALCFVLLGIPLILSGYVTKSGVNIAGQPLPGYTTLYVSAFGSDSNDGLGWGTAKATITAALGALPTCSTSDVKGNPVTAKCGNIYVAAGTLAIRSTVTISSPFVSVIGQGSAATQFIWTGAGCGIVADGSADITAPGPMLQGFSVNGSGDANALSCGVQYTNNAHIVLRDVVIHSYTAAGDACLSGVTGSSIIERTVMEHVYLGNCTHGWSLLNNNANGTFSTANYGDVDVYINVEAGQIGITSQGGGSGQPFFVSQSVFHILVNLDTPTSSCANLSNFSQWFDNTGIIRCDGSSNASGFTLDATSQFIFDGIYSSTGQSSIANGGLFIVRDTATQPSSDFPTLMQQYEASTASATGQGFTYYLAGTYWNGSASSLDRWKVQLLPSSTESDLIWSHPTGPSLARFNFVGNTCIYPEGGGFGGSSNCLVSPGSGYLTNILPSASGTLALQGSDGISAGTITLLGGNASRSFVTAYSSPPVCTATDTTSANAVRVSSTSTTVSFSGTGSDVIAWTCSPAVN